MKTARYLLMIGCCLISIGMEAQQDVALSSDSVFYAYIRSLKNKGNDYYMLSNRIGIKQVADEYNSALDRRMTAGKLTVEMKDNLMQDVRKLYGDYYYENSDYDDTSYAKAEQYFKEYRDYYMRIGSCDSLRGMYIVHQELAQLYYKQGRYQEACDEMKEVMVLVKNYFVDEDEQYDKLSQYAICLARVEEFDEAISNIEEVLDNYEGINSERYGEALRKKAKILMLREEHGNQTSKLEALDCYRRFFILKKTDALAHFMGMNSQEREQYWMRIRPFVTDCYRLEDADAGFLYDVTLFAKGLLLQLDSAGGGKKNIHTTWQMIQEKLKPDACAIEFIQYEKYGHLQMGALVLKKTGEPIFVKMAAPDSVMQYRIGGKTVEERIHHIVGANFDNRKIRNAVYNDSTGLFMLIWQKQLVHEIESMNDVWFAPDGYMHRLAIEYMLPSSIMQVKCHRLTSTRRLLNYPSTIPVVSALLVGGINYNAAVNSNKKDNDESAFEYMRKGDGRNPYCFTYLNYSLKAVTDLFKIRNNPQDTLVTESLATEQCFRELCSNYPVIHVSSHGVFSAADVPQGTDLKPNLCDSTLSHSIIALAGVNKNLTNENFNPEALDGILSAREISSLDMSQTELAILCCCETGLGHITSDGVYGFQRGLKNAGVKAIVCSLWDIYENSSNLFMAVFHYYLKQGQSVSKSFQYARDSMIDYEGGNTLNINDKVIQEITKTINDNYNEPNYRDAFILIDALE